MGQHHPQLGAAALLVRLLRQLVHLLQHPLRLPDEPFALLGGDHARGGAFKDAQPVFLFQVLQCLADVGCAAYSCFAAADTDPHFMMATRYRSSVIFMNPSTLFAVVTVL
mgnify:CR=1 FL=1